MEIAMKHFNALESFDQLKEAGISENQARAIVQVIEKSSITSSDDVATKGDIARLELSINWLQRLFFGSIFLIIVDIALTLLHH